MRSGRERQKIGLYVHIPYCRRKCLYCDFYSGGAGIAEWKGLVDALVAELRLRKDEVLKQEEGDLKRSFDTVYIGGGTPSLMPSDQLRRLVETIRNETGVSAGNDEFTIETNPEDVTRENLAVWRDVGINRLSIGVQTFDDRELKAIGRQHDSDRSRMAVEAARYFFDNISIDLMYGLPGQSMESWVRNVDEAIQLGPQHISAYSLMYEDGTALTHLRDLGKIEEADEDTSVDMYMRLVEKLGKGGYEHYEISNFSLPGRRARHNSLYWDGSSYLGLGPSAHSYDGMRRRRWNAPDLKGYISNYTGISPVCFYEEEILSDDELREETVLTGMRTADGITGDDYRKAYGDRAWEELISKAGKYLKSGALIYVNGRLRLTEKGVMISDDIILSLA